MEAAVGVLFVDSILIEMQLRSTHLHSPLHTIDTLTVEMEWNLLLVHCVGPRDDEEYSWRAVASIK